MPCGADGAIRVRRSDRSIVTLIGTEGCPLEAAVVDFGGQDAHLRELLLPLLAVRRMSTLTIGGVLNHLVRSMDPECAYVNVGVWNGFTLLAGMAGNDDRVCIGVDDFSEFGGPREDFLERFAARRGPLHSFHEADYADFLARAPEAPIGVYLYDGNHSFGHQYRGLMRADPYFADDAVIVVDDTNLERAREATLRFANKSRLGWAAVLDRGTASVKHPTLWNGLMILQAGGGSRLDWPTRDPLIGSPESLETGDAVSVIAVGDVDTTGLVGSGAELIPAARVSEVPDAIERSSGSFGLVALPGSRPSADEVQAAARRARKKALQAAG